MTRRVNFLSASAIERAAERVLRIYSRHNPITGSPVPIEDILTHLRLSCDFDDLSKIFGSGDVQGALWVRSKEVFIDETLDPVEPPEREGRYRFTLSHEIGHYHLHRHQLMHSTISEAATT